MDLIAAAIWNPLMSLWYLILGVVFVLVTGAIAWRRAPSVFARLFGAGHRGGNAKELGHREAFLSALAAGVGVGNLAGVSTALHLGGPGALFWMWISALLGMSFRMCSTFFAIQSNPADERSPLFATPMAALSRHLEGSFRVVPKVLAVALLIKGQVAANLIQANSVAHAVTGETGTTNLVIAAALALLVAVVILGGVRSIVNASVLAAPVMVVAYLAAGVVILALEPAQTMRCLEMIFEHAFHPTQAAAGVAGYGVLASIQFGVSRGVFSHGSGIGIAPFLQGANHDQPARGAMMAAMIPVFDTLVICTVTGLVVLSSGLWGAQTGADLTVTAFTHAIGELGRVLILACLVLFAFTTIINWAHFSERCFQFLGGRNLVAYRVVFALITFAGPFLPVAFVWSLGDVLIGLILAVHLLPLTMIVFQRRAELLEALESEE